MGKKRFHRDISIFCNGTAATRVGLQIGQMAEHLVKRTDYF